MTLASFNDGISVNMTLASFNDGISVNMTLASFNDGISQGFHRSWKVLESPGF